MLSFVNRFLMISIGFTVIVMGQETSDDDEKETFDEEYKQIFQNMPQLIENMIQALKDKPEILERNDYNTFKRSVDLACTNCREDDDKSTGNVAGNTEKSQGIDQNGVDSKNDKNLLEADEGYPYFIHGPTFLSPEEVAHRAIEIERELEDYNKSH